MKRKYSKVAVWALVISIVDLVLIVMFNLKP